MENKELTLNERMKSYENKNKVYLKKDEPVIIRLDGSAFHTFTKGLKEPFDDEILLGAMRFTMKHLCENIPNCRFAYTQSDEITLVLYCKENTEPWHNYNLEKLTSRSASMATKYFNFAFQQLLNIVLKFKTNEHVFTNFEHKYNEFANYLYYNFYDFMESSKEQDYYEKLNSKELDVEIYKQKLNKAEFDSRAFNLDEYEVSNCLIWRQSDAIRNGISAIGQFYFNQKELNGLKSNDIIDKLKKEKNVDYFSLPTRLKQGVCCIPEEYFKNILLPNGGLLENVTRSRWKLDLEIPNFVENKEYITQFLNLECRVVYSYGKFIVSDKLK